MKDCRIVYTSMSSAFDVRNNLGYLESRDKSITIHMNVCQSTDYVPGLTFFLPWIMNKEKIIKMKRIMMNL